MKISRVLLVIFFLVALLGSIAGTSYYYIKSIDSVEEQIYFQLESVAQSRAEHIKTLFRMEKEIVQSLALIGKVQRLLLTSERDSDYNSQINAVNERLQKTVDSIEQTIHIQVVNKAGITIAGTNPALLGSDRSTDPRFSKLNKGEIATTDVDFPPEDGAPRISIASPVFVEDEIIGFVFMRWNIEKALFPLLLDKTGIGDSGETYLINSKGYAITPLLFVEDAVLKQKVDTVNSKNCFSHAGHEGHKEPHKEHHGHEAIETFLNYRGEKVLGAHVYIPEMEWCLLAEINEAEILGKQRAVFQRAALTIIIAILIISVLVALLVGKFVDDAVVLKKGKKSL